MGICLNNFAVTESKKHELAKSAWQIHVKTKMRSSCWDEKDTFGSLVSLLPFLSDAEAAALLPHSEGVCVNAQWPHSSLLPSVWSHNSCRVFRWLHPKRPASCSWYWTGNLLHAQIFLPSTTKASVLPCSLPQPSAYSIPSLSPLGTANSPPILKKEPGLDVLRMAEGKPQVWGWLWSDFLSVDLKNKEIWCPSALHPTWESASLSPAGLGRGKDAVPGIQTHVLVCPDYMGCQQEQHTVMYFFLGWPKSLHLWAVQSGCEGLMHIPFMEYLCQILCPPVHLLCATVLICACTGSLFAQHFQRKVVKMLTYPPGIFFWGWERSYRVTSCEDSSHPQVLSNWTVARSRNWARRSGQPQKQNWIGKESRILFWRDLMESVEFLMLTDVKMASVALPKSLPAHLISHENITEAS